MSARSSELSIAIPSEREIVMTREFDAPRDLVFLAHSSCEHLSHWWGPRKYGFASCEFDFRPGGKWRIVHRAPDGDAGAETLAFEEHDGKTTLTATSVFDTVAERDGMLHSGMEEGAAESLERLDEYLEMLREEAAR